MSELTERQCVDRLAGRLDHLVKLIGRDVYDDVMRFSDINRKMDALSKEVSEIKLTLELLIDDIAKLKKG